MMQEIQGFKSEINNLRKCPEFTQKQFRGKGWQGRIKTRKARQWYPRNLCIPNRPKVCL